MVVETGDEQLSSKQMRLNDIILFRLGMGVATC